MTPRLLRAIATLLAAMAIAGGTATAQDATPTPPPAQTRIQIDLNQILVEAREAVRAGDLERAVGLYRVILHFVPDNRVARIELSAILAAVGDRQRAAELLRDVDTDGLTPEVIDLIGRIAGPDRLTFFLVPEMFLDSNVIGQTSAETVPIGGGIITLNENARGNRGYGYGLTAGANYRLTDAEPRTTLTGGVTIRDFERARDDRQTAFASLSMQFELGEVLLTPSLNTAYRYADWVPREAEIGGGLAVTAAFGPVRNTLGGRYRHIDGQRQGGSSLDRHVYEAYDTIAFGVGGVAIRLDERFTTENWDHRQDLDNWEIETGFDATFVETPWIVPTLGGSFTYREFENPAAFFGMLRQDREYEGHVELLFRELEWFGAHPFIRYEHTVSSSNHPLFDFDRDEFFVGLRAVTW